MKTCFLFPGQGAQYPGMAQDLYEASSEVRNLFKEAGRVTGKDMRQLLFDSTEEELAKTDNTQIALTLADISAAQVAREYGLHPAAVAGFSLGEYPALYVARVIDLEALFRLVRVRGELMERESRPHDDEEGSAGMLAVIGLTREDAEPMLSELANDGAYLANHSSPSQLVISGSGRGLAAAERRFDQAGAMRIVRLNVSGPFHSPLLERARQAFVEELERFEFRDPEIPLYANVTGASVSSGEEARTLCGEQIVKTVEWVREENRLLQDGYDRPLEAGPGKVLTGLWRAFRKQPRCSPVGTLENIQKAVQQSHK